MGRHGLGKMDNSLEVLTSYSPRSIVAQRGDRRGTVVSVQEQRGLDLRRKKLSGDVCQLAR
jgi:hypothetical protein